MKKYLYYIFNKITKKIIIRLPLSLSESIDKIMYMNFVRNRHIIDDILSLSKSIKHLNYMKKLYLQKIHFLTNFGIINDLLIIITEYIELYKTEKSRTYILDKVDVD